MKKNKYLLIFIFLLCLIPTVVKGSSIEMIDYEVTVRKGPGTNYGNYGKTGPTGEVYTLKNTNLIKTESGCNSGYWYNIDYKGNNAYICSTYAIVKVDQPIVITQEAKNQCEADLKAKGFPESYWNSLCTLKAKYPNWTFNAVQTGYDFAAIVAKESCKNSISTSSRSDYQDTTCGKNYDSGYTGASQVALAYYMNPLNFIDERNIFMFESNFKNDTLQPYYANATKKILPSSLYFVGYIPNIYNYVANATSSGVSSPAIASRIRQEMGNGKLSKNYGDAYQQLFSCLSGNYTTRTGNKHTDGSSLNNYYNFYNIAAYDGSNVTHKALIYAKNHGWGGSGNQDQDRQKAVTGGAEWIYRNYTNAGQQTIYFNKFNVNPKSSSSITSHQYMTNVSAPTSEASLVYQGYQAAGALSQSMVFYIPVFGNLSAGITNTPGGITGDTNNDNTNMAPATMVVSSGYSLVGATITNVSSSTSIGDFKGRIQSQGGTVTVYSGSSQVNDGVIGTGMTVKVQSSTGTAEFTTVVKGDPSGDGSVTVLDLLQVQKYILGLKKLDSNYLLAADTSGDGKVTALDLLQIQKKILGLKEL